MAAEIIVRHRLGVTPVMSGERVLREAGSRIAERLGRVRLAVITDRNVANLHLKSLEIALAAARLPFTVIILPPGEGTKSFTRLAEVLRRLLEAGLRRSDAVVAFGGGVIGDLAGLAASLYMRGCKLVLIPTTLMAQVDAAIGGKNGINTAFGKNLIGTFHAPALVLADTALLKTLPAREFRAGYAEIVKHALLQGEKEFRALEQGARDAFGKNLGSAIVASQKFKAGVVGADERDEGARQSLNFGHTFAHAIEAAAGFDGRVLHGEALSVGLAWAFRLAEELKLLKGAETARVKTLLSVVGLPVEATELAVQPMAGTLLAYIARDKKGGPKGVRLLLPRVIGRIEPFDNVPAETLKHFLAARCR
jgi:3-dehydroquinate synthase